MTLGVTRIWAEDDARRIAKSCICAVEEALAAGQYLSALDDVLELQGALWHAALHQRARRAGEVVHRRWWMCIPWIGRRLAARAGM